MDSVVELLWEKDFDPRRNLSTLNRIGFISIKTNTRLSKWRVSTNRGERAVLLATLENLRVYADNVHVYSQRVQSVHFSLSSLFKRFCMNKMLEISHQIDAERRHLWSDYPHPTHTLIAENIFTQLELINDIPPKKMAMNKI